MNWKIIVLGLAFAGHFQGTQAMGQARKYLQQAFLCSQQAVLKNMQGVRARAQAFQAEKPEYFNALEGAAVTTTLAAAYLLANGYDLQDIKGAFTGGGELPPSSLSVPVQDEIKALFQRHGFSPSIFDNTDGRLGVGKCGERVELILPLLDRTVLERGRLDICRGTHSIVLEKKHSFAVLGHEIDHLKHSDSSNGGLVQGAAVLAMGTWYGQMLSMIQARRLAGTLMCAAGTLSVLLFYAQWEQYLEERSDKNAPYNLLGKDADPELLACCTEDLVHHMKSSKLYELQSRRGCQKFKELCASHPPAAKRIAYLEKLADKFREKKN